MADTNTADITTLAPLRDASALSLSTLKTLTRGALPGEEFRMLYTYGCSVIAAQVWLRYAAHFGLRCPPVSKALEAALAAGRRGFDNLHGQQSTRREISYGQRVVREAIARKERGESWALMQRQAG